MAARLLTLDGIDSFREVRSYPASEITKELIDAVKQLNEREELEPFLRSILTDVGETPTVQPKSSTSSPTRLSIDGHRSFQLLF